MAKRVWFIQQKPYDHMPLRAGLGLISNEELREYAVFNGSKVKEAILKAHQRTYKSLTDFEYNPEMLCPKIYTTRTHRLSGEYYVVEGSRVKAKPVVPEIGFKVSKVADLNLHGVVSFPPGQEFDFSWKTFPEKDLSVKNATFEQLRDELLRLNKKATLDTPFYVNLLEPVS
ncbi:MAG: hypothetical protein V1854_04885 [Methanobacteriota archaeon]